MNRPELQETAASLEAAYQALSARLCGDDPTLRRHLATLRSGALGAAHSFADRLADHHHRIEALAANLAQDRYYVDQQLKALAVAQATAADAHNALVEQLLSVRSDTEDQLADLAGRIDPQGDRFEEHPINGIATVQRLEDTITALTDRFDVHVGQCATLIDAISSLSTRLDQQQAEIATQAHRLGDLDARLSLIGQNITAARSELAQLRYEFAEAAQATAFPANPEVRQ